LFAFKKPLLGLQLALGAAPPPLLGLQLLHMLLQPIDAVLALGALARQGVALPLLRQLLALLFCLALLLRSLLACLRALRGTLLARQSRARGPGSRWRRSRDVRG
jgi:hypothetical protein